MRRIMIRGYSESDSLLYHSTDKVKLDDMFGKKASICASRIKKNNPNVKSVCITIYFGRYQDK